MRKCLQVFLCGKHTMKTHLHPILKTFHDIKSLADILKTVFLYSSHTSWLCLDCGYVATRFMYHMSVTPITFHHSNRWAWVLSLFLLWEMFLTQHVKRLANQQVGTKWVCDFITFFWWTTNKLLHFWQGQEIFLFFKVSRLLLGLTHPCIQWPPGGFIQGIEWPRSEADHLPPINADITKERSYAALPNMPSWYAQGLLHHYLCFPRTIEKHAHPRAILVVEVIWKFPKSPMASELAVVIVYVCVVTKGNCV